MNAVDELQGHDRLLDRIARGMEWAAQEIVRLRGLNAELLEALQLEKEAYLLGLYAGTENWTACTQIMARRGLSLDLPADEATDILVKRARDARRVIIAKALDEPVTETV